MDGISRTRAAKKPCRITRIGSGRDSPESPNSSSNPAGATKIVFISYKGFRDTFGLRATKVNGGVGRAAWASPRRW